MSALGVFVPFVHLAPYAVDHGVPASAAVWLLGAIGIGSTIGRFFLGGIADRMGRERFLIAMYIGMAASLPTWILGGSLGQLLLFALIFGLFYGGWVAILPAVVADLFGARHAGRIIGVLYSSVALGTLVGPGAAGFIYDLSHSYVIPIAVSAVANAGAAAVMILAARRASVGRVGR
jgi:MFS family permease